MHRSQCQHTALLLILADVADVLFGHGDQHGDAIHVDAQVHHDCFAQRRADRARTRAARDDRNALLLRKPPIRSRPIRIGRRRCLLLVQPVPLLSLPGLR